MIFITKFMVHVFVNPHENTKLVHYYVITAQKDLIVVIVVDDNTVIAFEIILEIPMKTAYNIDLVRNILYSMKHKNVRK